MSIERLETCPTAAYALAGGVWVMFVHQRPTAADMELARPTLRTAARRLPDGFPTLTWIMQQAGIVMDNDARKVASEITSAFAKEIRAQATLIEGAGFQGATVRAIVAGMDAMARSTCPKRVFAEPGPAVEWTSRYRPVSAPPLASLEPIVHGLVELRESLVRR